MCVCVHVHSLNRHQKLTMNFYRQAIYLHHETLRKGFIQDQCLHSYHTGR